MKAITLLFTLVFLNNVSFAQELLESIARSSVMFGFQEGEGSSQLKVIYVVGNFVDVATGHETDQMQEAKEFYEQDLKSFINKEVNQASKEQGTKEPNVLIIAQNESTPGEELTVDNTKMVREATGHLQNISVVEVDAKEIGAVKNSIRYLDSSIERLNPTLYVAEATPAAVEALVPFGATIGPLNLSDKSRVVIRAELGVEGLYSASRSILALSARSIGIVPAHTPVIVQIPAQSNTTSSEGESFVENPSELVRAKKVVEKETRQRQARLGPDLVEFVLQGSVRRTLETTIQKETALAEQGYTHRAHMLEFAKRELLSLDRRERRMNQRHNVLAAADLDAARALSLQTELEISGEIIRELYQPAHRSLLNSGALGGKVITSFNRPNQAGPLELRTGVTWREGLEVVKEAQSRLKSTRLKSKKR